VTDGAVLSSSSRQRIAVTGPSRRSRVQIPVDLRYELSSFNDDVRARRFSPAGVRLGRCYLHRANRCFRWTFVLNYLCYSQIVLRTNRGGGPYQVTTDACLARNSIVGHCVPCVRVAFGRWNSAFRCSRLQLPSVWCTSIGVTEQYNRRMGHIL